MRPFRLFALCLLLSPPATAQREVVPGPDAGTRRFGTSILALPNGSLSGAPIIGVIETTWN